MSDSGAGRRVQQPGICRKVELCCQVDALTEVSHSSLSEWLEASDVMNTDVGW